MPSGRQTLWPSPIDSTADITPDLWRPLRSSGNTFISLWTLQHCALRSSEGGADEAFKQDGEACVANVSSAYSQQPHRLQPCIRRLRRYWPIGGFPAQDFNVGKSCGEAPIHKMDASLQ